MRTIIAVIGTIIVLCASVAAQAPKQDIGTIEITGYKEYTMTKGEAVITGPAVYVRTLDGRFEAKAQKMVIAFAADAKAGGTTGIGSVKTAKLTGNVWILAKPEQGKSIEATASEAFIDWIDKKQAILTGNVCITRIDPTMFVGPFVIAPAEKVTMSLKPDSQLGMDEHQIELDANPANSKITFTPVPPKPSEKK
jgi:lipopolysaccharide export system protein LptA